MNNGGSPAQKNRPSLSADFVLGTAQLGARYGIVNEETPVRRNSIALVHAALGYGVRMIDTANAYGDAEDIIGEALAAKPELSCSVITKVSPLGGVSDSANERSVRDLTEQSLSNSLQALRLSKLGTVLLHRAEHIHLWNRAVFDTLRNWRDSGRLERIGVSVQTPEDLELALEQEDILHVQLPINILDHRWDLRIDALRRAREKRGLTVHIRSIFLQGLLISARIGHWRRAHVSNHEPVEIWLKSLCQDYLKPDTSSLCISWARGLDWVSGIVIGCDNRQHLENNLKVFKEAPLNSDAMAHIRSTRPKMDENTLNPALWTSGFDDG